MVGYFTRESITLKFILPVKFSLPIFFFLRFPTLRAEFEGDSALRVAISGKEMKTLQRSEQVQFLVSRLCRSISSTRTSHALSVQREPARRLA